METISKETFWLQLLENPSLYGTITTEDNVFNYRSDCVWQVMNDTFIANGGVFETTKWEEMLGVTTPQSEELNVRKAAILNHITENLPITVGILEQLIKGLTNGDYILVHDKSKNKIEVEVHQNFENDVKNLTNRLVPTNINVDYTFVSLPFGYLAAEFVAANNTLIAIPFNIDLRINEMRIETETMARYIEGAQLCQEGNFNRGNSIGMGQWNTLSTMVNVGTGGSAAGGALTNGVYYTFYLIANSTGYTYGSSLPIEKTVEATCTAAINEYYLFSRGVDYYGTGWYGNKKWWKAWRDNILLFDLIPAINPFGEVCFYNKINGQSYTNGGTGSLIVGMNIKQAIKLRNLPVTEGGSIIVSLPIGYETDNEVITSLEIARDNGWTFTIQTYAPEVSESSTSTFGMRRIWVRKTQNENGGYVDGYGVRHQVDWCVEIYAPDNTTPEDHGYEQFRSIEAASEYWGLTPYIDPTLEEQLININEEQ